MASPFQRLRAWIAIAAFSAAFGVGLSTSIHFGPGDDAACGEVGAGGHRDPLFETTKAIPSAEHCPFCHWQRVVSGAAVPAVENASIRLSEAGSAAAFASRNIGSSAVDERPSRAPPA